MYIAHSSSAVAAAAAATAATVTSTTAIAATTVAAAAAAVAVKNGDYTYIYIYVAALFSGTPNVRSSLSLTQNHNTMNQDADNPIQSMAYSSKAYLTA